MKTDLKNLTLKLRKERSSLAPVFSFHVAEVEKIGKNSQRETTDDEALQYVKKTVQKLKENPHANQEEIGLLEGLLPEMVSREKVQEFLDNLDDLSNKGKVMAAVKKEFGALVDMKMVSQMISR